MTKTYSPSIKLDTENTTMMLASIKKKLLSGGVWVFVGKVITSMVGLAINAMLARLLSPNDLGTYFLIFSVVSFGAMIGKMGLHITAVRLVAENISLSKFNRVRQVVKVVLKGCLLSSVTVGVIYFFYVGNFLSIKVFQSSAMVAVTGLIAGWMVVDTMQDVFTETFRGFHDIRFATIFGGMLKNIVFALCLTFLWWGYSQSSLSMIILFSIGAGVINNLVAGWLVRTKVVALSIEDRSLPIQYKDIFNVTWPLFITSLTQFALKQSDIWIVGTFCSKEEVALYGAVLRLISMVALPLLLVNLLVPPFIADLYIQGKQKELEQVLRTTATLAGVPAFVLLTCFIVLGGPILTLIYGEPYRVGAILLVILSAGQLFDVCAGSCGMMLVYSGHQMIMMIITIICGLFSCGIGVFVVPKYGVVGLSSVFASLLVMQNILMLYYAKKRTGVLTAIKFNFKR